MPLHNTKMKVKGGFVIENWHNTISSSLFRSNMKEIDDTPLPENETEEDIRAILARIDAAFRERDERIDELMTRVANLETQRTPQDENPDPEWYS